MPKGQKPLLGVLSKRDGNKKRKQTTTIFSLVFIQSLLISLHYSTPRPPFFAPFRTNVPPELFDWLICLIFFLLISLLNFGIPVYYHHCFDKNFYKIISWSFSVPCIWLWWNTKNLSFQCYLCTIIIIFLSSIISRNSVWQTENTLTFSIIFL